MGRCWPKQAQPVEATARRRTLVPVRVAWAVKGAVSSDAPSAEALQALDVATRGYWVFSFPSNMSSQAKLQRAYLVLKQRPQCEATGGIFRVEVARVSQRIQAERLRSYRLPPTELPVDLGGVPWSHNQMLRLDVTELFQTQAHRRKAPVRLLLRLDAAAGQLACFAALGLPDAGLPDAGLPDAGLPDAGATVELYERATQPNEATAPRGAASSAPAAAGSSTQSLKGRKSP